jgi:glucosamine--fructose-6-phosphate aminotransferase (isomerizing)
VISPSDLPITLAAFGPRYDAAVRPDPNLPLPGAPDPWAPSGVPAFRARPPYLMTEMIAAEPGLAERLVHRLVEDESLASLATLVREAASSGRPIRITGCGTSEHAAMGIAELLNETPGAAPGHEVRSVTALEAVSRPQAQGVLVAVSHEGGTHVANEALRAARAAGARTALITVGDGSPGAELAELVVRTEEQDQSWCHTVGYLSPLLVGVVLAARLSGTRPDALAIRALLDVSHDPHGAAAVASGLTGTDRIVAVGSGADEVSARELALKIAEGARLPASALELESVLHGHLAAATRWTGLVLVLTDARAGASEVRARAARILAAARGLGVPAAAILAEAIADAVAPGDTPAGRIVVPRAERVPGVAGRLIGAAMALQLLTERLARARAVDPDTLGREDPAQAAAHA